MLASIVAVVFATCIVLGIMLLLYGYNQWVNSHPGGRAILPVFFAGAMISLTAILAGSSVLSFFLNTSTFEERPMLLFFVALNMEMNVVMLVGSILVGIWDGDHCVGRLLRRDDPMGYNVNAFPL
jgi:hypothetical protein